MIQGVLLLDTAVALAVILTVDVVDFIGLVVIAILLVDVGVDFVHVVGLVVKDVIEDLVLICIFFIAVAA